MQHSERRSAVLQPVTITDQELERALQFILSSCAENWAAFIRYECRNACFQSLALQWQELYLLIITQQVTDPQVWDKVLIWADTQRRLEATAAAPSQDKL